jgi:hypothetical protein
MSRSLAVGISLRCLPTSEPSAPMYTAVQYRVPPSRSMTPTTMVIPVAAASSAISSVSGPGTVIAEPK